MFGRPKIAKFAERRDVAGLVAALGAKRAEDRWTAAAALGSLGDTSAADALAQALTDPDATVQEAAAVSLAQLGDPRATPALLQMAADPDPDERFIGAAWLGPLADKRAFEVLLRLLGDPDGRVREAAAAGLLRFTGAKVIDALLAALDDPASAQAAMTALSQHRAAGRDRAIRAIVKSSHPERLWAGGVQAGRALVASRPATVTALLGDGDASVRATAAELVRPLAEAIPETELAGAIDALERRGDVEALSRLGTCVEIPSWDRNGEPWRRNDRLSTDLRIRITEALGRLGDPRAVDVVAQQLGPFPSQDADDRRCARAAVEALPKVWSPDYLTEPGRAALRYALVGSNADQKLAETLGAIGDTTSVELLSAAATTSRDARRVVAPAMRRVTDPEVLVSRLLSDPADVRDMTKAVLRAGAAATPALVDALATLRTDGTASRTAEPLATVVDLLGKVGDKRAIEPLLALLDDAPNDPRVVLALLGKGRPAMTRVLDILLREVPDAEGVGRPRGAAGMFAMLLLEHGKSLDAAQQARAAAGFRAAFQARERVRDYSGPTGDLHRLLMWRIKGDDPLLRDPDVHDYAEQLLVAIEQLVTAHRTHWGEPGEWDLLVTVIRDRIAGLDDDQLARVIALEPIECEVWGGHEREMGGSFVTLDPEPLRQLAKVEQRRRARSDPP